MTEKINHILEEAAQAAAQIENPGACADGYTRIAETYVKYKLTGSLETLGAAINACEKIKYPAEKAKRLAWIASIYQAAGDKTKAAEYFERAVRLAAASETLTENIEALYTIAGEYIEAGLNENAAALLEKLHAAVTSASREVDPVCELTNIAELYGEINQLTAAETALNEAAQLVQNQDTFIKIEHLIEIARIYAGAGEQQAAEERLNEALAILPSVDPETRAYFRLKIADVYLISDDRHNVLTLLEQTAGEVSPETTEYVKGRLYLEMAARYIQAGDQEAAFRLIDSTTAHDEKIEDINDRIQVLYEASKLMLEMDLTEQATGFTEQIQLLIGQPIGAGSKLSALGRMAVMWSKLNNPALTQATVQRIQELLENAKVKTSGLSVFVQEIATAGDMAAALILARLIREPISRSEALCYVAEAMEEASPGEKPSP
jgi:tetratricopeptide (TPR) repeat protein